VKQFTIKGYVSWNLVSGRLTVTMYLSQLVWQFLAKHSIPQARQPPAHQIWKSDFLLLTELKKKPYKSKYLKMLK
jgi:hypothetical protein